MDSELHWLAILMKNRKIRLSTPVMKRGREWLIEHFLPDTEGYDAIIGYRADDSYFAFASAFLNNTISLSQLEQARVLGKLGEQIVLMSERAFERIRFEDSIMAPKEIYLPKKLARDTLAREEFQKEKGRGSLLTEKYILDIMREGWENDDQRLQRIVLR